MSDLVLEQGPTGVERLVAHDLSPRERRMLLALPGAVERKDGDVSFPPEPMVVKPIRLAAPDIRPSVDIDIWLDEERSRYFDSVITKEHVPATLGLSWERTLYEYQRTGAAWLNRERRAILGDEMGLGKTLQALAAAAMTKGTRGLIITVNSAKRSVWEYHVGKYVPDLDTYVCEGEAHSRAATIRDFAQVDAHQPCCLVVNHEMLELRMSGRYALLYATRWDWIIVDEAHKFQDATSSRSKGVARLHTNHLYLLSGTPVWNRPESVFGLLHLIDPLRWGSFWAFVNEYCEVVKTHWGTEIVGITPWKMQALTLMLAPIILRRTKEQVLPQLPAKRVQTIEYDLSTAERKAYRQLKKEYRVTDAAGTVVWQAKSVSERFHALRRLVNDPGLLNLRLDGAKKAVLDELVDTALGEGSKVVIFTWYHDYTDQLDIDLDKRAINHRVIYGGQSEKVRNKALIDFQTDPNVRVLVASIGALSLAVDVTVANVAIFAEGSYIASDVSQAESRLHRNGQKLDVMIYRLQARKTVEAAVWETVDDHDAQSSEMMAQRAVLRRSDIDPDSDLEEANA